MCSLDVTCMVNIPFKNGLSTKKRQETTTDFEIPNLNLLNNKN